MKIYDLLSATTHNSHWFPVLIKPAFNLIFRTGIALQYYIVHSVCTRDIFSSKIHRKSQSPVFPTWLLLLAFSSVIYSLLPHCWSERELTNKLPWASAALLYCVTSSPGLRERKRRLSGDVRGIGACRCARLKGANRLQQGDTIRREERGFCVQAGRKKINKRDGGSGGATVGDWLKQGAEKRWIERELKGQSWGSVST